MAQLAYGAGGAALGMLVGQPQLGFAAGSLLYAVTQGGAEDTATEGPRVDKALGTTSAFGVMRPVIYGTFPVSGNVIDASKKREVKHEEEQDVGGKGFLSGPTSTVIYYTAQIDLAIGLGEGPRDGIVRLYAGQVTILELVNGAVKTSISGLKYKIYPGDDTQLPDPTLERVHGVGETPAYRGEQYVVLTDFDLAPFGNNVPPFRSICTSSASIGNSTEQKDFGGVGQLAGLWQDKRKGFAYHQGNAPSLGKLVDVYDCVTRQRLFSMPFDDEGMRGVDEGAGSGLFSVPIEIAGEFIFVGPNSHFFVCVETAGPGDAALGVYDSSTGAYLGIADLGVGGESNFPSFSVNASNSTTYRSVDSVGGINTLRVFTIFTGGLTGLTAVPGQSVEIPFSRALDQASWRWEMFREANNRQGSFACLGSDLDTSLDYIIFVKENNQYPKAYQQLSGFGSSNVATMIWDSVQDLYWVVGESDTDSGETRLIAYGFDGSIAYNTVITDTLYLSVLTASFASERGGIMWVASGVIKFFNTTDLSLKTLGAGAGGGSGNDQAFYNQDTNSYWCTSSGHFLQLTTLERLTTNQLTLDVPVADICDRAGYSPAQYDVTDLASVPIDGIGVITDQQFRSVLRILQEAYVFDGLDKGDLVEFKLRGTDPVVTIGADELGAFPSKGGRGKLPLIEIDDRMDLELPGRTEITYYSEKLEYEQQTQVAHRWASAVEENKATMSLPVVLNDNYAAKLVDIKEHLSHIARVVYRIKTMPKYRYLCPGDVIAVTPSESERYVGQIVRKSFNQGVVELTLNRDDKSVFTSFRGAQNPQGRTIGVDNNPLTFSVLIDGPLFFTSHNNAGFPVANTGYTSGWKGGNIYRSPDNGASFALMGTFFRNAVIGNVDIALPYRDSTTPDLVSTFHVTLKNGGTIPSSTLDDVLKGENHALIGVNGRWEVVGIVNSTLQPDGTFLIEPPILRGRLATEANAGLHIAGDLFILLEANNMNYIEGSLDNINRDLLYRSASIGSNLFSGQVVDQYFRNTAECLRPLSPSQFKATRDESNEDIYFSWGPRTRFTYYDFWTTVESDPELYKLVVSKTDGTVLHTVDDLTDAFYNYTRIQQELDGLVAGENDILDATVQHKTVNLPDGSNLSKTSVLEVTAGPSAPRIVTYAESIDMFAMWEFSDNITNPAPDGTTVADAFGTHDATTANASNLLDFGETGLLPGPYKTSVKIDEFGRIQVPFIPYQEFNWRDFAVSVVFEAAEVKSGADSELFDMDDRMKLIWASTGELQLSKNSPAGTTLIQTGIFPVVGTKYIITVTYWNNTSAAPGQPLNVFVNGQKFSAIHRATSSDQDDDIPIEVGYNPQISAAFRLQMLMAFGRKLTDVECYNLQALSGLY